jgi:glycosyltransferase involved in cell wall biosynthesis
VAAEVTPDAVLISLGEIYDADWLAQPIKELREVGIPVVFVSQRETEWIHLSDVRRGVLRLACASAARAVFVSARSLELVRVQLAAAIPNGCVIRNPVGTSGDAVPWPAACPEARFACVARLNCQDKGQDVLLQVLGTETWKQRPWRLTLEGRGWDEAYLRDLLKLCGIEERVDFEGHVTSVDDLWRHEVPLLPSHREGCPPSSKRSMPGGLLW